MEIKTLAQIIAENAQKPERSHNHKDKKTANKPPRAQSNSARGFVMSKDQQEVEPSYETTPHPPRAKFNKQTRSNNQYLTKEQPLSKNKSRSQQRFDSDAHADADLNLLPESVGAIDEGNNLKPQRKSKKKKSFHPASPYQPKVKPTVPPKQIDPNSIKSLLAQVRKESEDEAQQQITVDAAVTDANANKESDANKVNRSSVDNLPAALKAYLKTPEQRQAEKEEIKANSRLRWLAFYYLSRREHSAGELRQKLLDKEQDPHKIEELLQEFAEKGYQSDYRTALMLIREGIRKGRGRLRIKNDFYKRKVEVPSNIDELIDMAMADNEEFVDVLSDNDLVQGVDWLRLAVEARVKKYGDEIPSDQKIKARQIRFLQYRGFQPNICFEAIKYNLHTLDERF